MPVGRPTLNLLKVALEDLSHPLQSAILAAKRQNRAISRKGITVRVSGGKRRRAEELVSFEVVPFTSGMNELYFMIVFLEDPPAVQRSGKGLAPGIPGGSAAAKKIRGLEQELATLREHLQSVLENQEVTNEELQSANEEILSSNEELQSTNEELETAHEELQSTNEELSTVNDELRNRNAQITEAQRDLRDLLTGVTFAIVGADFQTHAVTPGAPKLLNLMPDDVSGQIADMNQGVDIPDIARLVKDAVASRQDSGRVSGRSGKMYRFRVLPVRSRRQRRQSDRLPRDPDRLLVGR